MSSSVITASQLPSVADVLANNTGFDRVRRIDARLYLIDSKGERDPIQVRDEEPEQVHAFEWDVKTVVQTQRDVAVARNRVLTFPWLSQDSKNTCYRLLDQRWREIMGG